MIQEKDILKLIGEALEETDRFVVSLAIKPGNRIMIFVDGDTSVTIDDCVKLSRHIESNLDREKEDFELQVSSSGADQPLIMPRQYPKHIGRNLKVKTTDDALYTGKLIEAGDSEFALMLPAIKKEKKPETRVQIEYKNVAQAKIELSFK